MRYIQAPLGRPVTFTGGVTAELLTPIAALHGTTRYDPTRYDTQSGRSVRRANLATNNYPTDNLKGDSVK